MSKRKERHQLVPELACYRNMIQRCVNPRNPDYPNYGGRGIRVCERWMESYENFIADMGNRPPGLTLERINVNQDYSKENCVWESWEKQRLNKRQNVPLWPKIAQIRDIFHSNRHQ